MTRKNYLSADAGRMQARFSRELVVDSSDSTCHDVSEIDTGLVSVRRDKLHSQLDVDLRRRDDRL